MSRELRIAVLGVSGRMGKSLIAAIEESPHATLCGASTSPRSEWIGRELTTLGARNATGRVAPDVATAISDADVAIDFTLPEATATNLAACVAAGRPIVIGTTGHDAATRSNIESAARQIAIVSAPNMSVGVNLLLGLVKLAAQKLDANYDIEIFEAHHRNKKDAPSGTALALGTAAALGRGVVLDSVAEHERQGSNSVRERGAIGFSVFRGGDVVGDHTVTFAGLGERVELTHRASDRMAFARGAVRAAHWLVDRTPGLYSMQDVLGLRDS